jgi:hypothetical protein
MGRLVPSAPASSFKTRKRGGVFLPKVPVASTGAAPRWKFSSRYARAVIGAAMAHDLTLQHPGGSVARETSLTPRQAVSLKK